MSEKLFCVLFCILVTASVAIAAPVIRVDLSQSGDVERGWIDWNTNDVRLGNADSSRQFINEADFDDDFTIDFISIDSRNRGNMDDSIPMHDLLEDAFKESDPFDMMIKGLSAGIYTFTGYHHDTNEDVPNDDGTLNITLQDADGTRLVVDHLQQSWGPKPSFVASSTFRFRSDGVNDVILTFSDNNDGIHNEAYLNGFELSMWISRDQASGPSPENGATDVSKDVVLSWQPGVYAPAINGHRVYLSDVFADVNEGTLSALAGVTSLPEYIPAELAFGTTYYWRVDEANDVTGWNSGQVWMFATEPLAYALSGPVISASASSWHNDDMVPGNTVDGSGLDADGLHSDNQNDMWLSGPDDPNPWIQYEFDRTYSLHEMWVWNFNQAFESIVGFGLKDVMIEYSQDGANWVTIADNLELPAAAGEPGAVHDIAIDLGGIVVRYVRITAKSNWGGWNRYGLSEVRFFYVPMVARNPQPETGADGINPAPVLSWRSGRAAASHEVYFGTDEQAVRTAIQPAGTVSEPFFEPDPLALSTTYFWRVDEINQSQTPAVWQGQVWSFSTSAFLVIDDMESYNDEEVQGNRIYDVWIDGWNVPGNGAQVGYLTVPSVERTIVNSGRQSMPLLYDNTSEPYSEATRTFDIPQDWTQFGIKTLVVHFRGNEANTGGQLYVKVNGVKAAYGGDAGDITKPEWTQWSIDLASLATNIQSVTRMSIGIEGGSSGIVFIDDIQLWP